MSMDLKTFAADPMKFFQALRIPAARGVERFGECMAPFQRDWFQAIAPSLLAVSAGCKPPIARFWTERTKGGSKDTDVACAILWLLAFSRQPLDMQVGAADRDQARELKKAARDILRLNDWLARRVEVQAWELICEPTGSQCSIIATDIAGSHGARPDVTVCNELSHLTKEEFASNLLDNASKKPNGLLVIATNAGFVGTWQRRWRELARTSGRWHFHQFAEPAPWLGDGELEEAERRNSTNRFRRLFWGEWVSQVGDALDSDDIRGCIDTSLQPMARAELGWFYVGGLDLGIKHDHSALVVLAGRRDAQELRLAYAESWRPGPHHHVDLAAVERTILSVHTRFKPRVVGCDPWQAQLLMQRLRRAGVKTREVPFVGANLNAMAAGLLGVFRSGRIRLYDDPVLIDDLRRLRLEEKSYGYKLSAARDERGHCDLAAALAIAVMLAVEWSGKLPVRAWVGFEDSGLTPYGRAERRLQELEEHERKLRNQPEEHPMAFIGRIRGLV